MEKETKQRMNGLVTTSVVKQLKEAANMIINDLEAEGFDIPDIFDYMEELLTERR